MLCCLRLLKAIDFMNIAFYRKLIFSITLIFCSTTYAQLSEFSTGPLIKAFGKNAVVDGVEIDSESQFKVAFDVAQAADGGQLNRKFDSLARFINMHVRAGVKPHNIQLALVVHGKASIDLLNHETYRKTHQTDNPNVALLEMLMQYNVQVLLCGQSAKAYEIEYSHLVEGASLALSAMTAHAQLQQQGYTVNPF